MIDKNKINRFEVIDYSKTTNSRVLTSYPNAFDYSVQDDGKTLKVFINFGSSEKTLADGWIAHDGSKKCPIKDTPSPMIVTNLVTGDFSTSTGAGDGCDWSNVSSYKIIQTYQDKNSWIAWHGGECPVDGETPLEVEYRDGTKWNIFAKQHRLKHLNYRNDIIAYRIIKPVQCEPEKSMLQINGNGHVTHGDTEHPKKLKLSAEYCHKEIMLLANRELQKSSGIYLETAIENAIHNFVEITKTIESHPEIARWIK